MGHMDCSEYTIANFLEYQINDLDIFISLICFLYYSLFSFIGLNIFACSFLSVTILSFHELNYF